MDQKTALHVLSQWDLSGRYVFTLGDFPKLFPEDNPKTLKEGIHRLVRSRLLERVTRGVYVFSYSQFKNRYTIELIAKALRRGEYNYVSLESALSEYGAISQIPIDRLTVMTTGRKGEYHTPYGTIEFTHTQRSTLDIISHINDVQRPLRLATPKAAWRDLKRVGRNMHLVDKEFLEND